jgi:hypothetical protein
VKFTLPQPKEGIPQTLLIEYRDRFPLRVPYIDREGAWKFLQSQEDVLSWEVSDFKGE